MVGLDCSANFIYLLEWIIERLTRWKEILLSKGGRENLLKETIQSIPVFVVGIFKTPKNICKYINDAMSSLWWGDSDEQRKTH
jgi:hypothetical protein